MKAYCLAYVFLFALRASAEVRTWTFSEDGKVKYPSGAMSFAKGGRIDAEFLRMDTTNVVLRIIDSGDGAVPLTSLSEPDRAYVAKVKNIPVDEAKLEREERKRQIKNRLQAEEITRKQEYDGGKDGMKLTAKFISNFPEQADGKRGWIDAKYHELDPRLDRLHPESELGFSVRDGTGWLDCIVSKDKLGPLVMGLHEGAPIRLTGTISAPVRLETVFDSGPTRRERPILKVDEMRLIKVAFE